MGKLYVEQALSFGVDGEGLWKIQYLHPLDANKKVQAWVPLDPNDELIGEEVNSIPVAKPGERLTQVMGWLYEKITRYPYYWPNEGTYVDKFGYDFEVQIDSDSKTSEIEITQVAYDILVNELRIQPTPPDNTSVVDTQYEMVGGGGVLVKLTLLLDRSQPVSELNLVPFTKYPMELVSLMYEEDTESFHPKKEILLPKEEREDKKFEQTTQSIRFQFPVVMAKRFTIILRQQNPEKNSYTYNDEDMDKAQLWHQLSQREVEVTLDTTDGLETVSSAEVDKMTGWDIYLTQLKKYEEDFLVWQQEMEIYRQKQAERNAALSLQAYYDAQYSSAMSQYRAEFNAARAEYDAYAEEWLQETIAWKNASDNYQHDLAQWNKLYGKK